jgi:hypothetical protein
VIAVRRRPLDVAAGGLTAVVVLSLAATGCGSSSPEARPTTPARVQILQPTPDGVTGPAFTVRVGVIGGKLVRTTSGDLTSTEGHVHLTLDGKPYVMSYDATRAFQDVAPGVHALQAEFVAKDHEPFTNRPRAFVRFTVVG